MDHSLSRALRACLSLLLALLCVLAPLAPAYAEPEAAAEEEPLIDGEALDAWMELFKAEYGLTRDYQKLSVGFCYTATGECWFYDADIFMYSASLYKVPVSMLLAEKEAAGEITQETRIDGSTVQFLESSALTKSNNDSGHAMVSYLGGTYRGKCSDQAIQYTDLAEGYFSQDFYDTSYYTARFMTQVMMTLYEGGEERFPHVIEYLLPAQPGEYLDLTLGDRYEIAQKYGAFDEQNGYNNNHIAAIVYTPTPVIIVVMTRNIGDYQWRIADIGLHLADYALELDEKLAARQAAAQAAPSPEVPPEGTVPAEGGAAEPVPGKTAAPAPTEGSTAGTAPAVPVGPYPTVAPAEERVPQGAGPKLAGFLLLAALAGAVVVALREGKGRPGLGTRKKAPSRRPAVSPGTARRTGSEPARRTASRTKAAPERRAASAPARRSRETVGAGSGSGRRSASRGRH